MTTSDEALPLLFSPYFDLYPAETSLFLFLEVTEEEVGGGCRPGAETESLALKCSLS